MSNQVTVVGNLTREPELRYTPNGAAVCKIGIAVNRQYTNRNGEKVEQTDFFTVNAWRALAENIAQSCKVGTRVIVMGRLQSRSWETEEGQKRTAIEIEADEVGPSLRWANAEVIKASRTTAAPGGSDDWASNMSDPTPQEVPAAT